MADKVETAFAQRAILENLDYFKKRFLNREDGQQFDYPPRIIDIHLGYKGKPCQNQCVWCYDLKDSVNFLSKKYGQEQIYQLNSEIDKAIDWEKDGFSIEQVYLAGGGEPTLFPKVSRLIIDKFSKAGRKVWLTTNGLHIKKSLLTQVVDQAKGILISLPGTSQKSYQQNAWFDGFEHVIETVKSISRLKKEKRSKTALVITHVFSPSSIKDLESLILRLNDLGVDEFRCRYDLFSKPNDPQNLAGKAALQKTSQKYQSMPMKILLKSPQDSTLPEEYDCNSPFIWPTWNPLHGVFPCAHVTNPENRIESEQLNGIYSLVDIFEKPKNIIKQKCHRRCPSRIHWFNLFLNNHELGIDDIPQTSILVK
ncbi:MAG: hypothetical protein U9Q63_03675 [Patescibacteria group bacterium]|nr:hypothetical protein [Patescibacteria group bacterium]